MTTTCITLIPGDGVGPEVIGATRRVMEATGIALTWEVCEAGEQAFRKGISSGVPAETLASIERTKLVLKGPLSTPVGGGEKSANVMLRKIFDTYVNLRPVRTLTGVPSPYSDRKIDFVVVRENLEDLYAGIEHHLTPDVAQGMKLISRAGCERIIRFAFDYAVAQGRKKVQCATKANILKLTEGMFKRVFEEFAPLYPQIESSHLIVDNCAHQMVRSPENFDVVVMTNMNGDILSDLASGLVGGLGVAPGANIGRDIGIFEAVHGSAPRHAGQNTINPTATLLSGVMLLRHIGAFPQARLMERALEAVLEKGIHTRDLPGPQPVSTTAFTEAILREMDHLAGHPEPSSQSRSQEDSQEFSGGHPFPQNTSPVHAVGTSHTAGTSSEAVPPVTAERFAGVDLFVDFNGTAAQLAALVTTALEETPYTLSFIDNRGFVLFPAPLRTVECISAWRVRVMCDTDAKASQETASQDTGLCTLLSRLCPTVSWRQITRLLVDSDGRALFTKAQGE